MEDKVEAVFRKIEEGLAGETVRYQFVKELHQFGIDKEGGTVWLYIDRDLVDDTDMDDLVGLIKDYGVMDKIKDSKGPKWLYLHDSGASEVEEDFAK